MPNYSDFWAIKCIDLLNSCEGLLVALSVPFPATPIVFEDFQQGMGEFYQSQTATAEFIRNQGSTPSEPTGPRVDHTYGNLTGEVRL